MAKPKRIVLIRHGNSAANADKSVRATVPDHQIPLTPTGWQEAKEAGVRLLNLFGNETIQVYKSPYVRTRQTYEGIQLGAEYQLNILREYEDPRLREQDFGHLRALEAFALIDAERATFGTFYYRIPDGESGADCHDRISSFMGTLWRDFEKPEFPANALIVSHGLTLRLFLMRWFHWSVEKFEKLKNPFNAEHFVLALQPDGKYRLENPLREYTPEETEQYKTSGGRKPWMA
jgi:broad specificity phosphatase PhoE